MYEFKGFGNRIETFRKQKGITQEDLASKLGITSQAVSKWENGLSYPDIEIIPAICAILDISLDDIFGKIKKDVSNLGFPPVYKGLNLVQTYADVACYSDKEIIQTGVQGQPAPSTVQFKDGSIAEFTSRRIVNRGTGKILLKTIDDSIVNEDSRSGSFFKKLTDKNKEAFTSVKNEYGDIMELNCSIPNANCEIIKVPGDITTVYAEGYTQLIDLLQFEYDGVTLKLDYDKDQMNKINTDKWDIKKNNIKIELASKLDELHNIILSIHGSGGINLAVPSASAHMSIHGSGNISASGISFGNVNAAIHGSGNINFENAGNLVTAIHGSGNVNFNNSDNLDAKIHGSGNVNFNDTGECSLAIHGSGDVRLNNSGVCKANIHGSGDISANYIESLESGIHGSGDIEVRQCNGLSINIHGSGDFKGDKVNKSISASIRGSGDIVIREGEVETFNVYIDNGKVNARGVTAQRAKIEMPNRGRVEIGRVVIESIEKCGDHAEVIIHHRGRE